MTTERCSLKESVFYWRARVNAHFFLFSQLKENIGNVSSTFPATRRSQKVQSARLASVLTFLPPVLLSPSFLPLHAHLQGKGPSPQLRLPQVFFHTDPLSTHPHVTGLPVLGRMSAPTGQPGPSFPSFSAAHTAHGRITSRCLTIAPAASPLPKPPCPPLLPLLLPPTLPAVPQGTRGPQTCHFPSTAVLSQGTPASLPPAGCQPPKPVSPSPWAHS